MIVRHQVKHRLHTLLPNAWATAGQTVDWMWDEPTQLPAGVTFGWFGQIRGDLEIAAMRAGNPPLNDTWRMDLILGFWLPGNHNTAEGEIGVLDAVSTVLDVMRTNPTLSDGTSVPDCLYSTRPGELDGPTPWRGTDGAGSACRVQLVFTARI